MLYPDASLSSAGLFWWMVALLAVVFLIPYVCAARLDLPRGLYVAVLTGATVVFAGAAAWWTGLGWGQVASWHWLSGLVLAPVVAVVPAFGITRMPATRHRQGAELVAAMGWDAAVYGVAEGLLLSALPAFLAAQWMHQVWPDAAWLVMPVTAVVASVVVIVVHHLGYPEFRHPTALVQASVACGLLTVGYLITGSIWTPVVGHVLMHAAAVAKGNALPPHSGIETPAGAGAHVVKG